MRPHRHFGAPFLRPAGGATAPPAPPATSPLQGLGHGCYCQIWNWNAVIVNWRSHSTFNQLQKTKQESQAWWLPIGCSACRGTFLFYDRLRQVALAKLDQDPTRLTEIADILLSIYQCERRTFRYMAHVMLAAQQSHKMKQAIAEMDSSTVWLQTDVFGKGL